MQITVEIPDEFVSQIVPSGIEASRRLIEEAVAGSYREGRLSMDQVRRILGLGTLMQVDLFLQAHEIYDYTIEDFQRDMATMERLAPLKPARSIR